MTSDDKVAKTAPADPPGEDRKASAPFAWMSALLTRLGLQTGPTLRDTLEDALEAREVHALAHVTGGGMAGNLSRVLPAGCRALLEPSAWEPPPLMRWLVEAGAVPPDDARRALNLGIGMLVVCAPGMVERLAPRFERAGERVFRLGSILPGESGAEWAGDRGT